MTALLGDVFAGVDDSLCADERHLSEGGGGSTVAGLLLIGSR